MRDTTFWDVTVPRAMTIYANAVFVLLWVGFILALVLNQEWLDVAWARVQALPLVPRIFVWVLFLPVLVGLWIWESSWSTPGRLMGFAGIIFWTFLAISSIFKHFR